MEPSSIVRVKDSNDPLLWDLPGASNLKTLALNFGICNKQIANIIGARIRESNITTVGIFNTQSREPRPHPEFELESFLYVEGQKGARLPKGAKLPKGHKSALKFLLPIKANFDVFWQEQEVRLEEESKNSSAVGKEIVLRPRPRVELLRYTFPG